jgi:hypothetical protein
MTLTADNMPPFVWSTPFLKNFRAAQIEVSACFPDIYPLHPTPPQKKKEKNDLPAKIFRWKKSALCDKII